MKEDLVCELSQGRLDEEYGPNACAAIVMKAAIAFLDSPGKQPVDSEEEMYSLMRQGISFYKDNEYQGKIDFISILETMRKDSPEQGLQIIYPKSIEGFTDEALSMCREFDSAPSGELDKDLLNILKSFDQLSEENGQKACGIFVCHGETMAVAFPQPGKPVLFDSHGRRYKDMDKGASILQFDSSEKLAEHLQGLYKKKDEPFQFIFLTKTGEPEQKQEKSEKLSVQESEKLEEPSKPEPEEEVSKKGLWQRIMQRLFPF
jgi:hypothetical protein